MVEARKNLDEAEKIRLEYLKAELTTYIQVAE